MPAQTPEFYNLNEQRSWPIDERTTGLSDEGVRLPDDILADLHMRFPNAAGPLAFVSGLVVTERVVSLVVSAAASEGAAGSFVPLAAVTIAQPVDPYRPYPIEALYPGTGGWVVFGSGVESVTQRYSGRFSSPTQSRLMVRCARAYKPLPVTSIGRYSSEVQLTGLVWLSGGNDIEIVRQCLEIPNYPPIEGQECDPEDTTLRDVVVFRLAENTNPTTARNVLDLYRGPCGKRPESLSCLGSPPIQYVGPVGPDCCGNIVFEFRGCAYLSRIESELSLDPDGEPIASSEACGAVLDCPIKISQTCSTINQLPDSEGNLPNDTGTLCLEESSTIPPEPPIPPDPEDPTVAESVSIDEATNEASASDDLPFTDLFTLEGDWTVITGEFAYLEVGGGIWSYGTEGGSGGEFRNLSIWIGQTTTVYRRAISRFELQPSGIGILHNAGVAFGYRMVGPDSTYWKAELDWDGYYAGYQAFRISRVTNNSSESVELDVPVLGISLSTEYQIEVVVVPAEDNPTEDVWVKVRLSSEVDLGFSPVELGWLRINGYISSTNYFGLTTYRAVTRFLEFTVENTTDLGGMA